MRSPFTVRRRVAFAPALVAALAVGAGAPPAGAQTAVPASVRLVAADPNVMLVDFGSGVFLDVGVYVASVGGDFELHATRADYGAPIGVVQVVPGTRTAVRTLPANAADGWNGLRDFLRVTIRNRAGRVVADRRLRFCPGFDRQRVSDAGPPSPRYIGSCGGSFPFTRGTVWGIEAGWAVSAVPFAEEGKVFEGGGGGVEIVVGGDGRAGERSPAVVRLRPGRYAATVRIASPYRELFAVSAGDAEARVSLRVKATRRRRPPGPAEGGGGAGLAGRETSVPTVAAPDPATLPDLVALPVWNVRVARQGRRELLAFAASPWNGGPGPLVVEGFRRPREPVMDAFQYFHDADGDVVGRAPVGTMRYHEGRGHDHWHFLQFVSYTLVDGTNSAVVRSRKQSYCLAPTDAVDLTIPGALWTPFDFELGSSCGGRGSIWVRETLFAGWADTYFQSVAGQAFDITRVPNGRYGIVLHVNPLGVLQEASTENNVEVRTVTLTGPRGRRRAIVAPWHSIRD